MKQDKNIKITLAVADAQLKQMLLYLLKAWEYNVSIVGQGQSVVEYLKKESPGLVIIDAAFQDKKGLKICKEIKNDFLTAYTPTIILIEKRQLRRDLLSIEEGVDDYLIKPPDPIELEIRIVLALRSAAHNFNANALTSLPGNRLIEKELYDRIKARESFSFHYIDIDNFKSYNDKYGYLRGDQVILGAAKIFSRIIKARGSAADFLGHIGGDDFVAVTSLDKAEIIAKEIISDFDAAVPGFYSEPDKKNKFIVTKDRMGKVRRMPLMSLSVAIVNNPSGKILSLLELTDISAEIKRYLKEMPGSNFMVNRRVHNKGVDGRKADK